MAADYLKCKQCDGSMYKTRRKEHNIGLQLVGVLVFFVGVAIAFYYPVVGWVLGPILCLVSLGMGYKSRKIWLCQQCGAFFERS